MIDPPAVHRFLLRPKYFPDLSPHPAYAALREDPPPGVRVLHEVDEDEVLLDCVRPGRDVLDAIGATVAEVLARHGLLFADAGVGDLLGWAPTRPERIKHVAQLLLMAIEQATLTDLRTDDLCRFLSGADTPGYERTDGGNGRPRRQFMLVDAWSRCPTHEAFDAIHTDFPAQLFPSEIHGVFALVCHQPGRSMLHAIGSTVAMLQRTHGLMLLESYTPQFEQWRRWPCDRVEHDQVDRQRVVAALLLLAQQRGAALGYGGCALAEFVARIGVPRRRRRLSTVD